MDLATGTVVDRYTVQRVLGEGGMAVVYLCRHHQLGTSHALKVLSIQSKTIRERLVQEGQVQASLRHRNIVAVTDIVMLGAAPGLVMEYIEGPTLDALIGQQQLTFDQVDALADGILAGVAHAHAQGLVHRDLKPANIMLALEGSTLVPKVTDFGLAKLLEMSSGGRAATRTGSTMGTPHYMSPEQVSDSKNVDHRTDVFALGAILYELVCNRRSFNGDDLLQIFNAVAQAQYVPPRQLRPDLPERMERAIIGALEPDRDRRIASVDDLLAVWTGRVVGAAGTTPTAPTGPFGVAFVNSLRAVSAEKQSSVPPGATYDGGTAAVSVESLYRRPEPQASRSAPPVRTSDVPATSLVRPLVVGSGVVALGAVGVGVLLLALLGVGGVALMWSAGPEVAAVGSDGTPVGSEGRAAGRAVVEPAPAPESAPTVEVPGSTPEPGPVARRTAPEPRVVAPAEPTASAPPAPPAPPAPASQDGFRPPADFESSSGEVRGKAIARIEADPSASAFLVGLARRDPSRDVQVRAWQAVMRRYSSGGPGDRQAEEVLLVDALRGKVNFSVSEAAAAYSARGQDLDLVLAAYDRASSFHRIKMASSVAAVARGSGQTERGRTELEARKAAASGVSAVPERGALSQAINSL